MYRIIKALKVHNSPVKFSCQW